MNRRTAAELSIAGITIVWGATFVLVKTALLDISPMLFVALRFLLATVVLVTLFGARAWRKFTWQGLGAGMLAGTFLFSGYIFQTWGLTLTTAPKSAFITGLSAVMVPVLAAIVYRVRPLAAEGIGVAMSMIGLGLMTLQGDIGSIGRGDILTFVCALGFAAHVVALGHYAPLVDFEVLSIAQIGTAALWALALCRGIEPLRIQWRPAVVWAILITGLFCTALAFAVQTWAQRYTTSTRTALLYMLEPVVAWLTSYVLVGEGLSRRGAVGAALILGGVLMAELKPGKSRPHPDNQEHAEDRNP